MYNKIKKYVTKNSLIKLKDSTPIHITAHKHEIIIPVALTGLVNKFLDDKGIKLPLTHHDLALLKKDAHMIHGPIDEGYAKGSRDLKINVKGNHNVIKINHPRRRRKAGNFSTKKMSHGVVGGFSGIISGPSHPQPNYSVRSMSGPDFVSIPAPPLKIHDLVENKYKEEATIKRELDKLKPTSSTPYHTSSSYSTPDISSSSNRYPTPSGSVNTLITPSQPLIKPSFEKDLINPLELSQEDFIKVIGNEDHKKRLDELVKLIDRKKIINPPLIQIDKPLKQPDYSLPAVSEKPIKIGDEKNDEEVINPNISTSSKEPEEVINPNISTSSKEPEKVINPNISTSSKEPGHTIPHNGGEFTSGYPDLFINFGDTKTIKGLDGYKYTPYYWKQQKKYKTIYRVLARNEYDKKTEKITTYLKFMDDKGNIKTKADLNFSNLEGASKKYDDVVQKIVGGWKKF
jgi:hypothetical protein